MENKILATVNGTPITDAEVDAFLLSITIPTTARPNSQR